MNRWNSTTAIASAIAVWAGAAVLLAGPAAPEGKGKGKEPAKKIKLRLLSSVERVMPGAAFDVALAYDIVEDWHIYWKNSGDSGMAPAVNWQLPDGFTVESLRFPPPKKHESGGGAIITYVLYDKPVLLAKVKAPETLPDGQSVKIGAKVTSLVCKENCLIEKDEVSVELPTAAAGKDAGVANEKLFADARSRLPVSSGKGTYVSIDVVPSPKQAGVNDTFQLTASIAIKSGYHLQSNAPKIPGLIPTLVLWEPVEGVEFGDTKYPKAKEKFEPALGMTLSEFHGKPVVKIDAKVTDEAKGDVIPLNGILIAQACEDNGRCYPPEAVEWSTSVRLVGGAAAGSADEPITTTATVDADVDDAAPPATGDAVADAGTGMAASSDSSGESTNVAATVPGGAEEKSLLLVIGAALIGGLLLNVMPCVLPVISIKILSFVQQADENPKRVLQLGLMFSAGIVVSFLALAAFIVGVRASTGGASWGQQFSHWEFVTVMAGVVFVFALSLLGVFEVALPGAAAGKLGSAVQKEGMSGAFMKGVLATLLATPCTAPYLGPAVTFAISQPNVIIVLILAMVGVGMAVPYVLLTANPAWLRYLPKPGAWMDTFKQFMGFVLLGTVVWLLRVQAGLVDGIGVVWTVALLGVLAIACWMYGRIPYGWGKNAKWSMVAAALVVAVGGVYFFGSKIDPGATTAYAAAPSSSGDDTNLPTSPPADAWDNGIPWIAHTPELHKRLAAAGHTVYVDYTAIWCATCQTNKLVLDTQAVRNVMRELGVVPLKADNTRSPQWIADELKEYGATGVPLNVILPAGQPDKPLVLPTLFISTGPIIEALREAGSSERHPTELVSSFATPGATDYK